MRKKNINFKKIASVVVGVPAAIIAVAEVEDLRFVWFRFAAAAVVAIVCFCNFRRDEGRGCLDE